MKSISGNLVKPTRKDADVDLARTLPESSGKNQKYAKDEATRSILGRQSLILRTMIRKCLNRTRADARSSLFKPPEDVSGILRL